MQKRQLLLPLVLVPVLVLLPVPSLEVLRRITVRTNDDLCRGRVLVTKPDPASPDLPLAPAERSPPVRVLIVPVDPGRRRRRALAHALAQTRAPALAVDLATHTIIATRTTREGGECVAFARVAPYR